MISSHILLNGVKILLRLARLNEKMGSEQRQNVEESLGYISREMNHGCIF